MSKYIVRLEDIGKQYRISSTQKHQTKMLREVIQNTVSHSVQSIFRNFSQQQNQENDPSKNELFWALKHITFDVFPGDSIGIIGPNGAGKSTLLKLVSRITWPTTGRIRIRGRVGSLLEVGTGFHPELTGRENVYLNGAILGMRRQEIARKFDEIVAFSEVDHFIDMPVKRYSSGMKMRLAFSVAAHLDPEIMLVDEVLAVGDIAFQTKSLNKMSSILQDGRTVFFVSHNIAAIRSLCNRAVFIDHGEIQAIGNATQVAHQYITMKKNMSSEVSLQQHDPQKPIQILSAKVLDSQNHSTNSLPQDQDFNIQLDLSVNSKIDQTYLSIKLFNEELELVSEIHDFEANPDNLMVRKPGRYKIDVRFPGNTLRPGQYFIGIALTRIRRKGRTIIQSDDHIAPFQLYDPGSLLAITNTKWNGYFHPSATWHYSRIEKSPDAQP